MHELSIAMNIVEQSENFATEQGATQITMVELEVGRLSGVVKECLEFVWPEATKATILEKSKLEITEVELTLKCSECGQSAVPEDIILLCPHCLSTRVEVLRGKELTIKKLEMQ